MIDLQRLTLLASGTLCSATAVTPGVPGKPMLPDISFISNSGLVCSWLNTVLSLNKTTRQELEKEMS